MTVYCKVLVKIQDSLLQTIEDVLRSVGPMFIPLMVTRCLYMGGIEGEYGGNGCRGHMCCQCVQMIQGGDSPQIILSTLSDCSSSAVCMDDVISPIFCLNSSLIHCNNMDSGV